MKAVHLSVAGLIAALLLLVQGISTKNSATVTASIVAIVTAFLPAVQYLLPWYVTPEEPGDMPVSKP